MSASARFSAIVLPAHGAPHAVDITRRSLVAADPKVDVVIPANASVDAVAAAVRDARGEFVMFVAPGDTVSADLFTTYATVLADDTVDAVYGDEDRIDDGVRVEPWYKPDWSPDRFACQQYLGHVVALRRSLLLEAGGIDPDAGAAFEWDALLRVTERARQVRHVREVVVHRSSDPSSPDDVAATTRVLQQHLVRTGVPAIVAVDEHGVFGLEPALHTEPLVSIVIPTGGAGRRIRGAHEALVEHCVRSVATRSTYRNIEIVCVIDGQMPPHVIKAVDSIAGVHVRWVRSDPPFSFSGRINDGVLAARGEYVILLNDDTEVITPNWIEHLMVHAADPEVGSVGARLLFEDGRIQHAGIVAIGGDPGHPYYGFPAAERGYHDQLVVPTNCLAVTAGCLMTRRDTFLAVGGMSLLLPLNYNDVDFGLKLRAAGLRTVCTPKAQLWHFESSSRGWGPVEGWEHDVVLARWRSVLNDDPYHNPNFLPTADFVALDSMNGRTPRDLGIVAVPPL